MDRIQLQKLRDLPIEGVAERLGLRVVRHKALCPFHDDHHASLSFKVSKNTWRCFVCGASGGTIDLVMRHLGMSFLEACRWLGCSDGEHPTGRQPSYGSVVETVFPLPSNSTLGRILRQWTTEAGITKHVTFHTARHSYATMALCAGADIYTVSKLLGHRNINTTTIYTAVVDTQRDAAVDSVSHLLQQQLDKYKNA